MSNASDFVIENGVLMKYIGPGGDVAIPEGVTGIAAVALERCVTLRSVAFPQSVTAIGEGAFRYCESLQSVTIPGSVEKIYGEAFIGCGALQSLTICEGVKEIGKMAFRGCASLQSVTIPKSVVSIGDSAFSGCRALRTIKLPESMTYVGSRTFDYCESLESISLPRTQCRLGEYLLSHCKKLKNVRIPDSVTVLPKGLFHCCSRLSKIDLPESVTEIENAVFYACEKLTAIRLPSKLFCLGRTAKDYSFGGGAFARSGLVHIQIPGSVESVGIGTFEECICLKTVEIGEGVKNICDGAFRGCTALETVSFPESLQRMEPNAIADCPKLRLDRLPKKACIYAFGDENGCRLDGDTMVGYVGKPGVVRVTEGVVRIENSVFDHLFNWDRKEDTTNIILPDSVRYFGQSKLNTRVAVNLPAGYLQQDERLPGEFVEMLLGKQWMTQVTFADFAALFLFQSSKKLKTLVRKSLDCAPQKAAEAFLSLSAKGMKAAAYLEAADFIFTNRNTIEQETVDAFYKAAVAAKAKKAVGLLRRIATEEEDAPQKCAKAVAQHPIEEFCQEQFVEHHLDKTIKKAMYAKRAKSFEEVLYKDSEKKAPAFVVKCAIVPYIALMKERPKHIGGYQTDYLPVSFIENADKVAAELDPVTFVQALEKIASVDFMGYDKPQCLIPLCRYGNENHIKELVSEMRQWENWISCGSGGRSAIIVARGAIMLNDSREAMLYIEKCKQLYAYARMRGMDEDVLRDTKLAEFGLDANGRKIFDLGNTTIEASVGQDLAISLYDVTAKKIVKSLPKKGADADKHAAASAELSDLKKNLKKVVKSRNDILFERFLDGRTQKATAWIGSYTKNPVLRRVAELIVWNQKKNTFILTKNGAVDCDGNTYLISDGSPVGVAHPKDMTKAELAAWQKYFTSHGLKQPFEQIWEPVVDSKSIQTDRYKGCMIPFFRFKGREKHGIFIQDWDFHNQIDISFEGCDANVERIDWRRHDIGMDDRFEITSFSIGRSLTRKVNHIVAYLDRITVYGRILNDDVSVVGMLPMFTLAQIMEFINAATENKCTNVLAVLLDYKNRTFIDFDPMEEFSLDL